MAPVKPYTPGVDTPFLFEAAAFVLGLLTGSFLNVCIARIPKGESIVRPGSRCPQCGRAIRWYDNVPLLSWVVLRGRCRDCRGAISWRYPAVELAVGVWFALAGARLWAAWFLPGVGTAHRDSSAAIVLSVGALGFAALGFLLIGLMVMDWQTLRLPDAFTLTGVGLGLFVVCAQAVFLGPTDGQITLSNHHIHLTSPGASVDPGNVFLTGPETLIFGRLFAVSALALLLLVVRALYRKMRGREGMGLGDVKLLAMVAAFLGFWPGVLALFVGVITASAYGVYLLARRRAGGATRLPFGSFLAGGGLVAALFGTAILEAYGALLR